MANELQPRGLSSSEAAEKIYEYGRNEMTKSKKRPFLDFLGRFLSPLTLILIIAAGISAVFGDHMSSAIIITIVFASNFLEFINTHRSEKAAEMLRNKVKITTAIIRDGKAKELPVSEVVPNDIIVLSPGDIVPADGIVIGPHDFFVNESSLTGESFPVEKDADEMAYTGSSVVSGTSFLKVTATGNKTKFGEIETALIKKQPPTEFDRSIKDFSYLIMKITFALVIFIFFANVLIRHSILNSFLFAAALAVGLTPELLPMIITLNLTKGSLAMAKRGVIVKKLSSIQNCGSMDILCTDKTGTLTENKIVMVKHVDISGKDSEEVFKYAYLNSFFHTGIKGPLEKAVKDFRKLDSSEYKKIDDIPFDFIRKRDAVLVKHESSEILIAKGAPEEIFRICNYYKNKGTPFSEHIRKEAEEEYRLLSRDGFRVLGLSIKKISDKKLSDLKIEESGMIFIGFVAFLDPAKKTAGKTIRMLEKMGIEIKILTGDNELVTQKIAKDIGIDIKGILRGEEMENMTDDALKVKVIEKTIFSRVNPAQKTRIIKALQSCGKGVGYMGDGINDAPSLKAADVGISVNNAVDVAKESADMILSNKNLDTLLEGISEGRKTLTNTSKYLMMTLSSNFGNMFSMAGASLFIPFFPMMPSQILFNNLAYDGSQFAIPLDNVDETDILKPRKFDIKLLKKFMFLFGIISSVFDFVTFFALFFIFHFSAAKFQTGWFIESIATQIFVVYIIRTKKIPFVESSPSLPLAISTVATVVLAWIIGLTSLGRIFRFEPLPASAIVCIIAIIIAYLLVVEIFKRIFYRKTRAA